MKKFKRIGVITLLVAILTMSVGYKSDFFEVAKQIEIYTTLFKELNMYYINETNPAKLTENAIDNMLQNLDPYTRFYDEQGVERARITASGEYGGIGATTKIINNKLIVIEPYENSPADLGGIKSGDEIIKINNLSIDTTSVQDISLLLNGLPNSKILIELNRQGKKIETEITREKIDVDPVPYHKMLDQEVGYISFIKFNSKASTRVKEAFEDLKTQGMKKLILDIRGNLGGLLNEAVEITNFFIPKDEVVVTTKAKVKKWSDTYKTKRDPIDLQIPIIVLIDHYSASASEIVAGSLQDLDRAVVIGERSYGKGLVQRYRKLTYGTQLKLTISKYYTPSGRCIQELDYSNRNDNGEVPKYSDKSINAFKTRNGRTVYDGGGIEPDVKLEKVIKSNATKSLIKSNAIFNYATDFYYSNPEISPPQDFSISDKEYQKFLKFLFLSKSDFKSQLETKLSSVAKTAEKEGYNKRINIEYKNLMDKIKNEKVKDLEINKEEIKELLTDEIIRRYYYKKGEYIHKTNNDMTILAAADILNDEKKYRNILN
jgi:carboxyl-terminal processing protease